MQDDAGAAYFCAVPGSAIEQCCSATAPAERMFAIALCSLFIQPLTKSPFPAIMAWG